MLNSTAEKMVLPILKLEITYIVHISTNRVMALNLLNSIVKFGDQIVLYLLIKHHRPFFLRMALPGLIPFVMVKVAL